MHELEGFIVTNPPTFRRLETCYHQGEGIYLVSEDGKTYLFIPLGDDRKNEQRTYTGNLSECVSSTLETSRKASLIVFYSGSLAHNAEVRILKEDLQDI